MLECHTARENYHFEERRKKWFNPLKIMSDACFPVPTIMNCGSIRSVDMPMWVADGAATTSRLPTSDALGKVTQYGIWYKPGAVSTLPSSNAKAWMGHTEEGQRAGRGEGERARQGQARKSEKGR